MDTLFMNSENRKTYPSHRLLLNFTNKTVKYTFKIRVALSNLRIYCMWKNIKSSYKTNKSKISDESYSISDILDYFERIIKKYEAFADDPRIKIHFNKIIYRSTSKIKIGYYLELLTAKTMTLLQSTENKITKDKNGENVPHLEITELVIVYCNIVNNGYQQDLRVLYTLVPNINHINKFHIFKDIKF